jgi:hypothetical protein
MDPSPLELELRVVTVAAEATVARRIDVVTIAHDEHDALRQGDRQTRADAAEVIAR